MGKYTIENGFQQDSKKIWRVAVIVLLAVIGVGVYGTLQNPEPVTTTISKPVSAQSSQEPSKLLIKEPLPWPEYGQSAYGVANNGVLALSDTNAKPVPVASLAKVITAIAVLKHKPIKPGEQGPMITLQQKDVESYSEYVRKSGAVVPVEAGEQISEYQALQAMLMPSANNIADSLVIWAFGSMDAYNKYANTMVSELGLTDTTVADASGFSPSSKSTADNMVKLGIMYMEDPLLKQIAMQTEATIPVAGIIPNYNTLVNKDGLLGIKVGDTDEAGRCFMLANVRDNGSKDTVSVTVVLGAEELTTAAEDAETIINAGDTGYDKIAIKP